MGLNCWASGFGKFVGTGRCFKCAGLYFLGFGLGLRLVRVTTFVSLVVIPSSADIESVNVIRSGNARSVHGE